MFNPYACRPIGTEKFLEHLCDCQTEAYYNREIPEDGYSLHGRAPWNNTQECDGWTKLAMSVMYGSFLDYLTYYRERNRAEDEGNDKDYVYWNSKCLELENGYFRKDPVMEKIFDKMLVQVCWRGNDAINESRTTLIDALGWTKDCRRKKTG